VPSENGVRRDESRHLLQDAASESVPKHRETSTFAIVQPHPPTAQLRLERPVVPTEYSVRVVAVAVADQRLIPFSNRMTAPFIAVLASLRASIRSRLELAAEILALRHQLAVLQRTSPKRPRFRPIDRLLWMLLSNV